MHRIDSRNAHNGTFRAGNPIDGTLPTALTPEWFNATQEEIVNVIVAANMPLDKTDNSQLLKALRWLIADAVSKALAGNDGGETGGTGGGTTNHPPTTPTVITDLPATITRGSSYDVKFAATDPDNDAVTFTLSNLVGCTAAKTTGIGSAGTSITIGVQADAVSFAVIAVDSKGAASAAATVSRSAGAIINPTASTGWLTAGQTYVIDVPDWADNVTFTGNGGAGGAITCTNDPYGYPYTFISGELLAQATYVGSDADANYKYAWDVPYVDAYTNHGFRVIADTMTKPAAGCYRNYTNTSSMRYYELLTAATSAGASTTITGAVTATFSGSAAGYTTSPAQTSQIKSLPVGTGRTLSVYVPLTGTFKADWS